jgi:signal transduction histidine kinase
VPVEITRDALGGNGRELPNTPRHLMHMLAAAMTMIASLTLAAQGTDPPAPGGTAQQSVLFLAVEDFTRPYVRLIFEAFSDAVLAAPDAPVIYFETLDASRFEDARHLENVREWLRRKYRDTRIDLVAAISEDALAFLASAKGEPWPDAQIIYLESGNISIDVRNLLPQAGGMQLEDHLLDALRVIRQILPETRHIALLYGASSVELTRWRTFSERVRTAGLEPIELGGLSIEATLPALRRLPEATAVLILAPSVDGRGHVLAPNQACELIAPEGIAPTFTLGAHDLGCGVVGGLMRDWTIVGKRLGEEILARLKNASADVVTVPIPAYTTLAFDQRQLERWTIPESRLPQGAVIRFREPNLWRDRRGLVIAIVSVTVLQSLLIAGLVFEHRRRRRAEIDSRRNLAALAHLDRRAAMGELASSLAHELSQPLNAILQNAGVAGMLLSSNHVPSELGEMSEIIGDIRKDDIRASEIIRRMRGLLQKRELEAKPVNLNDVAAETAAIVQADATARTIKLETELAPGLRPVLGDRVHLQQVLLNLLMNAMDAVSAMPPERRRVQIRITQLAGGVRLDVVDAGAGIQADQVRKMFEPFFTTKSEGIGMGMGLAIARSIVEAHDGLIGAENNTAGDGATVWFSLPFSADQTKGL